MAVYTRNNIVTNGLVLALDAANQQSYVSGSTLWRDVSGNNISGSLVNGPTFSSIYGGSIVFDGSNDYITFGSFSTTSPLSFTSGSFTLEHWVKPTALQPGTYFGLTNMILTKEISAGSTINYATQITTSGSVSFIHRDNSESLIFNTFTVGNLLNAASHLVFTINSSGTQVSLYVNGILSGTQNLTGKPITPYNSQRVSIGGGNMANSNAVFIGNIYINRIYNTTLSAQEVLQNYNATKTRFGLT
jgi:hypothetical protein